MNKEEFFQMLQETKIRQEILRIVKEGQNCILNTVSSRATTDSFKPEKESAILKADASIGFSQETESGIKEKNRILENENNRLREEMDELRNKFQQAQDAYLNAKKHIQAAEGELQESQGKIIKLSGALEEAQQKAHNLQMESDKWKNAYQTEKRNSDTLRARLQSEMDGLRQENQRLEKRKHSLERANQSLQSQLEQRFAHGWELFEEYKNVSDHTKQLLHNAVFTQETDFMAFICGGAQTSSLEKLWDALRECIIYGQKKDAEILWEIFEYSIELVNSTKTQARYEVLPVNEGDRFDSDVHTEGPSSLAQGNVVNVYLPGYKNTYNEKIIKKSIVQVG